MPKWCPTCRANGDHIRAAERTAVRRCYRCDVDLPEAKRKPGKAVCNDCRVDKRVRDTGHEQRRRLRRYGITQQEYDLLFARQGECCAGCRIDRPGPKGWCIDHDHETGRVRGIMCSACNTVLGLVGESSITLRLLADFLERSIEIKI